MAALLVMHISYSAGSAATGEAQLCHLSIGCYCDHSYYWFIIRWVVIAIPAATMMMIIIHRLYVMSNVVLMDAASGMLSAELIIGQPVK